MSDRVFDVDVVDGNWQWCDQAGGLLSVIHKGWFCGHLRVPRLHAAPLSQWIEAFPSLTEAAKMEVKR